MGKYDGASVEVVNWFEYNPRSETKYPTWFRFENGLATSEKLFGLTCEQKWLWVVILSLLSRKNGQAITWNSSYVEAISGIKSKVQEQTIEIFEKIMDLRVTRTESCDSRTDTDESRALRNGTVRTNGTNETNGICHPLFEIWNKNRGKLPEAKELSPNRKKSAQARWSEKPSTEYWTEIVVRMSRSPFLRGEKNDPNGSHKNWKADFDFFLKPETHVKVTEGKYDDRNGVKVSSPEMEQIDRELKEAGIDVA